MPEGHVRDDETVVMRIPPGTPWCEPPDQITSANFKLDTREGELGLSAYRLAVVTAEYVLRLPDAIPGSRLARATAGAIRNACDGSGKPLELDVIATDDNGRNPGHVDIRGPIPGKMSKAASRTLKRIFCWHSLD